MKLYISEPESRESGPILVCDEAHNDIAEFFHNEHATVGQSYETALALAQKFVADEKPSAWQARAKVGDGDWFQCNHPDDHNNPEHFDYRPLYRAVPQEALKPTDLLRDVAEPLARTLMRCQTVLGNMAAENEGAIFNRWPINHEPLRADAKNLAPIVSQALTDYHKTFMKIEREESKGSAHSRPNGGGGK